MKACRASFDDGRNPGRQRVRVVVTKIGLAVRGGDNLMLAHWGYADLTSGILGIRSLELRCASEPEALLVVRHTKQFLATLRKRARQLAIKPSLAKVFLLLAAGMIGFPVALAALWTLVMVLAGPLSALLPHSVLQSWSRDVLAELGPSCSSMPGQRAIDTLAQRLAKAGAVKQAVAVTVLDTPGFDARSLPDGRIILSRGLLNETRTPSELAAALAHQVAHVKLRSAAASAIRGFGTISIGAAEEADAAREAPALLDKAGIGSDGQASLFPRIAAKLSNAGKPSHMFPKPPPGPGTTSSWPALTEPEWDAVKRLCGR